MVSAISFAAARSSVSRVRHASISSAKRASPIAVPGAIGAMRRASNRHARPCAGHPRLKTVDGRVKPGHDE
ncbi:MAG TPA: hypothetical protein VF007_08825, partial [Stellaceae bacterium]